MTDASIDWPLDVNIIRKNSVSHTFGMVRQNADGSPRPHQGWDFYAEEDTPFYAVSSGKVEYCAVRGDFGLLLVHSINDTDYYAAYAHLKSALVKPGEFINKGQLLGYTGNTGSASTMKGANQHLHFEVRNVVLAGKGLANRASPLVLFKECPLKTPVIRASKA